MARIRKEGSKISFAGLGLKPAEDVALIKILKKKEISYKKVVRMLVRRWMEEELKH